MTTKKQQRTNAWKTYNFIVEAMKKPSWIGKTELKPYVQTRDDWMVIVVKFKRRIAYHFHLTLDEYTEFKRLHSEFWEGK